MAAEDAKAFTDLIQDLAAARRRNGGYGWTLMQDAADPETFVETWFEWSWAQHLRHHERVSGEDRAVQERLHTLHKGDAPPVVEHYLRAGGVAQDEPTQKGAKEGSAE